MTNGSFQSGVRVLSSGGDQVFFAGTDQIPLSTGRPDGSGGDTFQASHWKDNRLNNNVVIGIMDPAIGRGERNQISANDILALNYMGYRVKQPGGGNDPPAIGSILGNLIGDRLTLTGSASDPQSDFAQAQVTLLDGNNNTVRQDSPFPFSPGGSNVNFSIQVNGLNGVPTAFKASLMLIDAQGNHSASAVADFSQADPGGASIRKGVLSSDSLVLKGDGFVGPVQIEVNGVIISPPGNIKVKPSGAKIVIPGSNGELNLHSGANRIREIQNGLKSNIIVASP